MILNGFVGAAIVSSGFWGTVSFAQTVVSAMTTVITGTVGLYLKGMYDSRHEAQTDDRIRSMIKLRALQRGQLVPVVENLVERIQFTKRIEDLLRDSRLSGVCVLAAPPGTGKTAYLRTAINAILQSADNVCPTIFYVEGLDPKYFQTLGVPEARDNYGEFLPKNSVVIFDQVDNNRIDEFQEAFIVKMATQSRNSWGGFRVFVQVSDPQSALKILKLNCNEKIFLGVNPLMYRWGEIEMKEFVNKACPNLTDEQKDQLVTLYLPTNRCGLLCSKLNMVIRNPNKPITASKINQKELEESIKLWQGFSATTDYRFGAAVFDDLDTDMSTDELLPEEETINVNLAPFQSFSRCC
jgi:hypothetical protein